MQIFNSSKYNYEVDGSTINVVSSFYANVIRLTIYFSAFLFPNNMSTTNRWLWFDVVLVFMYLPWYELMKVYVVEYTMVSPEL